MIHASGGGDANAVRVLRIFSRLNIGGPSLHVILLSSGLRSLGYETRLVVGRESPREGNMLELAARKDVNCERMAGLGREIVPLQDLLGFDSSARMNIPGVAEGNWSWRLAPGVLTTAVSERLRDLSLMYNRISQQ